MLTFLFEQYGYYPNDLNGNYFTVDKWKFKLIQVECEESYLSEINEYLKNVRQAFQNCGVYIIKTRYNNFISLYDGKKYVLISINHMDMSLRDLNKFHCLFIENQKKVDLNHIIKVWQERVSMIENNAVNSLRLDSVYYKSNLETTMFCLGMSQNAIQYLSETITDYGKTIENVTVVHKRINDLNSFDFFNPFNMIIDHPIKDLSELYKSGFINFEELAEELKYYNLNSKIASVLMARLMYNSSVFDQIENNIEKKDLSFKINYNVETNFMKLKKAYTLLKNEYNIRPIDWLENSI